MNRKKKSTFITGVKKSTAVLVALILVHLFPQSLLQPEAAGSVAHAHTLEDAAMPWLPADENEPVGFEELQEINPDVFGWITVYGTNIDYPLLQGEDNHRYVYTNAMGAPAMSGAIFLDFRNANDFSDFNHIIYGHDMRRDAMFGEIINFSNETFFERHPYGMIFTGDEYYGIEFFAFLLVDANDTGIYHPTMSQAEDKEAFLARLFEDAIQSRDLDVTIDDRLVVLSTCTPTATNGRHILVGRLIDFESVPEEVVGGHQVGTTGLFGMGRLGLAAGSLIVIVVTVGVTLVIVSVKGGDEVEQTSEEAQGLEKKRKPPTMLQEIFFLLAKIGAILIVVIVLFTLVFGVTQVNDATMAPAMREGDLVFFQRTGDIEISDAIVVMYNEQTQVRRVVAVAGDTVDITYDGLFINGFLQQEFHIFEQTTQFVDGVTFPLTVPEGEVFVLGDSRVRARDSRMYGTVRLENVLGRVVTVVRRRNL